MKQRLSDLAILGGAPAFSKPLHVGRPNIGDPERLLWRFRDVIESKWLTNSGPLVSEFERRVASILGVRNCVAVCNATVALEIAVRAMGFSGEVIVPSFTFVATVHALQWQGITPVFCDIDPNTHNIDPRCIESLITPRTSGIIGVHVWGRSCDVDSIAAIAKRHNLGVLYDAAHAFACTHNGNFIGSFGQAEILSFHATKFINSSEGGAVLTNDDDLAARIRLMKNFGFEDTDQVVCVGTNGKMPEVCAAMGLTTLESMSHFISVNQRNYAHYRQCLAGAAGLQIVPYDPQEQNNHQYVVIDVDEQSAGLSRDVLCSILRAEGVLARRYFYPGCHRMEPYRTLFPEAGQRLAQTERISDRVLSLPTGTAVNETSIAQVCGIVEFALAHAKELSHMVSALPTPEKTGA